MPRPYVGMNETQAAEKEISEEGTQAGTPPELAAASAQEAQAAPATHRRATAQQFDKRIILQHQFIISFTIFFVFFEFFAFQHLDKLGVKRQFFVHLAIEQ